MFTKFWFIPSLSSIDKLLPKCIKHEYMEQTSKKSVFLNSELIDSSENSSEGMIRIMQHIHRFAVSYINGQMDKIVFGGDLLTNERALSAQQAMLNGEIDFLKLLGVIKDRRSSQTNEFPVGEMQSFWTVTFRVTLTKNYLLTVHLTLFLFIFVRRSTDGVLMSQYFVNQNT